MELYCETEWHTQNVLSSFASPLRLGLQQCCQRRAHNWPRPWTLKSIASVSCQSQFSLLTSVYRWVRKQCEAMWSNAKPCEAMRMLQSSTQNAQHFNYIRELPQRPTFAVIDRDCARLSSLWPNVQRGRDGFWHTWALQHPQTNSIWRNCILSYLRVLKVLPVNISRLWHRRCCSTKSWGEWKAWCAKCLPFFSFFGHQQGGKPGGQHCGPSTLTRSHHPQQPLPPCPLAKKHYQLPRVRWKSVLVSSQPGAAPEGWWMMELSMESLEMDGIMD